MRMKKLLSLFLALVMVLSLVPATVFATEGEKVYISASHDGHFIDDKNGSPMAYVGVALDDLTAINLDTYGLSDYKYDKDGDGSYEITALHLYIYTHEVICGLDWDEVTISGGAGSIYFAGGLFGFEDENLRYNYNGAYPADENGWGFTADQIVLSDGDFFEVAHFSDWSFFTDSAYGFHYFTNENDDINISYSAETGTALPLKLIRVGGGMGMGDTTTAEAGYTVYYGSSIGNAIGSVTTDGDGVASITFSDPGTYYVWCNGGKGDNDTIVSSPASATVTVTGEAVTPEQPGNPEEKTDIKVTIDEGMDFYVDVSCCDECYTALFYSGDDPVTSVNTTIDKWECEFHGANPPAESKVNNIAVSVSNNEKYFVKGATINDNYYAFGEAEGSSVEYTIGTYAVKLVKNQYNSAIYAAHYEDGTPEDITIHIHVEKEEAPREAQDVSAVLNATMAKLAATVTEPAFGTNAGEWTVLSLARGGYYTKDNAYFTDYYNRIVETVNETAASVNMNGALHKVKSTENSRLIVALSALGKDATAVGNWDLVDAYSANGFTWIKKQGINGTIWALIALDSHNYATSDATIRQQCVDSILSLQHDDGGWSLMANKTYASDPDITGMALTALYPYRDQPAVAEACAEAIACLSAMQHDNGTFASGGSECSESCAWVIVSTTTWGINPDTDSRFIKNGESVVDGLLAHYLEDEAQFQHTIGAGANGMATDQSCYALVAYDRFVDGKAALYDYSDVSFSAPGMVEGKPKITLGLPKEVNNDVGTDFNAVISIDQWDNEGKWKLVDFIMTVPDGLKVTGVTAGNRLAGGEVSYNVDANSKLRVVYFDANENSDLTMSGTAFPAEVFTVTYEVTEELKQDVEVLPIAVTGMSIKLTSDSSDENAMIVVDVSAANGMLDVVEGVSYSAVCLYEGDDVDLIPSTKKAVAVAVAGLDDGAYPKLTFKYNTFETEMLYSAEITAKSGVQTYVALVNQNIPMVEFTKDDNFTLDEENTDNVAAITFGDSNTDGEINAQDALAAVDAWLRKTKVSSDTQILTLNVNGDSRINTFDALGIVEQFVDGSDFGVVTKAATITTENN